MALQSSADDLRSAWKAIAGTGESDGWRIIPLNNNKRLRVGVRFPERREAFLVGFNFESRGATAIPQGKGFEVENLPTDLNHEFSVWISVSRRQGASLDLFVLMVEDLIAVVTLSTTTLSERRLYFQFMSRIRSWQRFMEKPAEGRLSDAEEIGLYGELLLLKRFLEAGMPPDLTIELWKGPENAPQDFRNDIAALEVKSTLSVNGFPTHIASLDQLDGMAARTVYLAGLRFAVTEAGTTLPEIVEALRKILADGAAERSAFERLLLLVNYTDKFADDYVRRFQLHSERLFCVDEDFPYLSRTSVPLAILDAEYHLDLDEISVPSHPFEMAIGIFESK
ncbi:hypothetical protein FHS21_006221 [Phyllobacterium trifolii]|uniref:PD-(D/E)XK motif protein n=1 Tax=Phyllobacterium trifolii TaxID=300193 RepID=A0A839UGT1_9HYPH|nr:PD-(D/E)XK motif protein [Phyllobacterium trifolii]MBB3149767.1 hypothetical protein [Phyllobacterium trifolii]